jgi:hypothetical protein
MKVFPFMKGTKEVVTELQGLSRLIEREIEKRNIGEVAAFRAEAKEIIDNLSRNNRKRVLESLDEETKRLLKF